MYFCYNLEKEEGSLKTELKNCLSLYKIVYSCAFILILCVIHPIIYYEEIGSAISLTLWISCINIIATSILTRKPVNGLARMGLAYMNRYVC